MSDDTLLTKGTFAKLVGVKPQQVSKYLRRGLPVIGGKVPREAGLQWYRDNVRTSARKLEQSAEITSSTMTAAEASRLKLIEDYRKQKLGNDEKEASLVPRAEVDRAIQTLVKRSVEKLLVIPEELSDELSRIEEPAECQLVVRNRIDDALAELTGYAQAL